MSDELLDYKGAAKLLGVKLGTLYWWVHNRTVPHHKMSDRVVRFSKADLVQWLKENKVTVQNLKYKGRN